MYFLSKHSQSVLGFQVLTRLSIRSSSCLYWALLSHYLEMEKSQYSFLFYKQGMEQSDLYESSFHKEVKGLGDTRVKGLEDLVERVDYILVCNLLKYKRFRFCRVCNHIDIKRMRSVCEMTWSWYYWRFLGGAITVIHFHGGPEMLRRHLNFRQISHRFTLSFTNPSFQDLNGWHIMYWNMIILNPSRFKVESHSKYWYFCIERVDLLSLRFSENAVLFHI